MEKTTLNNRYVLQKKLGEGAFATVWLAQDQQLNRPVAVKLMDSYLLTKEPTLARQFQQEALAVARLSHPNIIHIYDAGVAGSQPYQVMEYLPGGDLAQKLSKNGACTLEQALALLKPLAAGLQAAHAANMIHQDLKPQNILFAADGRPVITDFGLVKVLSGSMIVSNAAFSRGTMMGTPGYMAPEQIDDELGDISPATDLFALAVIAYELLTGARPFTSDTVHKINHKTIYTDRKKLINNLPNTLPKNVYASLYHGLAVLPQKRPKLSTWLRQLCKVQAKPTPPNQTQRNPQKAQSTISVATNQLIYNQTTPPLPHIIKGKAPLNFEWCLVPAGEFIMGCDDIEDAQPPHTVYLDQFYMARHPVTNAQYLTFVDATNHSAPKHWQGNINHISDHPVTDVSWGDAVAFCQWASQQTGKTIRLPTEAEWEKAARGTDERLYPWGNDFSLDYCNSYNERNSINISTTTPVDHYPQNESPYGVQDMVGNVYEWVLDGYWYSYHNDGITFWTDDFHRYYRKKPIAPFSRERVVRGGSWRNVMSVSLRLLSESRSSPSMDYNLRSLRVSSRIGQGPGPTGYIGFRCVSGAYEIPINT